MQGCLVILQMETNRYLNALYSSSPHREGLQTASNLGLGFHLGPVLEQVADYVCLASPGCHVERCLTSLERRKESTISGRVSAAGMDRT